MADVASNAIEMSKVFFISVNVKNYSPINIMCLLYVVLFLHCCVLQLYIKKLKTAYADEKTNAVENQLRAVG
jgi:hypothetical protein